jgi:hypothetical protein
MQNQIILPAGIKSLNAYAAALSLSVHRIEAALETERAELARVRRAVATQKKAKPIPVPVAKPLVGVDTSAPLSTQVQGVARHCGLVCSSVYNEKTKTKGRKIKLHLVYRGKSVATGTKLSKAKFEEFAAELRRVMSDAGIVINSIDMLKPNAPWQSSSIAVFFA